MKTILLFGCLLINYGILNAQSFEGTWEGRLRASITLRIAFFIENEPGNQIKTTWQSPDQSKVIFPTDTSFIKGDSIFIIAKKFGVSYRGKKINDTLINGIFTQGADIPLNLQKVDAVSDLLRPQTPSKPFGYHNDDVTFKNSDATLSFGGTLTWPGSGSGTDYATAQKFPAVLLVSGSGPQDRDETLMGHKPFAVMADYLTKKGFAVLRVDDRGVGKSTGDFGKATTADFVDDAETAINFLKRQPQVDSTQVGIIGHSEGAIIAPMLAARRKDIGYIVLLAGPGVPVPQLMEEQAEAVAIAGGSDSLQVAAARTLMKMGMKAAMNYSTPETIEQNAIKNIEEWAIKQDAATLKKLNLDTKSKIRDFANQQMSVMSKPWYRYFLKIDPQFFLMQVDCEVLALSGSKDVQVLPATNLGGIKAALLKSKSPHFDVLEMPGLNHLFQTCKSCAISEYGELEETISPKVLELVANWINRYGK